MKSPLSGIQAAKSVFIAGNVVPSPIPSNILITISHGAPPKSIAFRILGKIKIIFTYHR